MDTVMITGITGQDFDEQVLKSELPVFACFVAQWCHSCFPTCLIADELAEKYEGQIKFVRVDAEKSPEISDRYNLTVLPTIIIFQGSQLVKKLLGYHEKTLLRELLDALLAESQTLTITLEQDDGGNEEATKVTRHQVDEDKTIRERIVEEEAIREKIDKEGNRWTKVYFGGGAHFRNWLNQFLELRGEDNVEVEEMDSRGFQCYEESGEKMYRIWVKDSNLEQGDEPL